MIYADRRGSCLPQKDSKGVREISELRDGKAKGSFEEAKGRMNRS